MKSFTYTIKDALGMHARPAGLLVKYLTSFPCSVTIECKDKKADGKRLFGVMGLGVKQGDVITVTVDGDSEDTACAAIEAFLEENV